MPKQWSLEKDRTNGQTKEKVVEADPTKLKRKGPTPIDELETNIIDLNLRKGKNQVSKTLKGKTYRMAERRWLRGSTAELNEPTRLELPGTWINLGGSHSHR